MTVSGVLVTALDFVGLWMMFSHHRLARWVQPAPRSRCSTAPPASDIGFADLLIGSVERLGQHVRTGSLDTMMVRPVPAAGAGVRRRVRATPARPDRPGRARLRLGRLVRRLDAVAGRARGRRWWSSGSVIFFCGVRRVLLPPVLDQRRQRVRQRVHLRRQHRHAVPPDRLPARGRQGADVHACRWPS